MPSPEAMEKGTLANTDDETRRDVDVSAAEAVKDIKSPGVARIEALTSALTLTDRIVIFCSVFLVAFAYGLDGTLRYTYEPIATGSFGEHSLLATINVIRSVISAAAQPTSAKIADVFGRVELLCVSVFFYVLGTVVVAVSENISTYAAGTCIYQVGYTMVLLLVEVIVADCTSTRARLFFSYIPALPFVINTWVSGDVSSSVLKATTWKWGIGMWCIIYPVCAAPLIVSLWVVGQRAKRQGRFDGRQTSLQMKGAKRFSLEMFWLLDIVGVILVIAVFALILVPLTIAGGFSNKWKTAHVIAPLVVGILCIPVFILWELKAPHPLVPFNLMKDRSVWAPVAIAVAFNFAYALQNDYLYTILIVAFDFSVKTATRIQSLYSFVSVIIGVLLGLVVYKVRRLKPFIIFGTALYMVAFGLLIRFRGATDGSGRAGVIGAQVLLGVAGGLFPYPTQASLQVYLRHENLAVITGVYLAVYNVGSAFGNTVSGAIWTQVLPSSLERNLRDIGNSTLAAAAYANPFPVCAEYPIGTPERDGIITAYQHVQKLLTITGICLCVPLIALALFLRNPHLTDQQNLAKESDSETDSVGETTVR